METEALPLRGSIVSPLRSELTVESFIFIEWFQVSRRSLMLNLWELYR